jgi:pyruvate,water dikinase
MRSLLPTISDASNDIGAGLGVLIDRVEFRVIGGWTYARLVPLGDAHRSAPPAWLFRLLVHAAPALRRRVQRARQALRTDLPVAQIEAWYGTHRAEFAARTEALNADRTTLSDHQLTSTVDTCVALLADGARTHFRLHGAIMVILAELAFFCHEQLGWDDTRVFDLLAGTSAASTAPARALAEAAQILRASDPLRRAIANGAPTVDVLATDPDFRAALERYRQGFGRRAMRYDIAERTLAEDPQLLVRLVADQLASAFDPSAPDLAGARANEAAAAARHNLTGRHRSRFDELLARARRAYPVREDNEFHTVSAPYAQLRYTLLEVGRRLIDRAVLAEIDDVFQLTVPDAIAALRDSRHRHDIVRRHRAETAWALAHPGPDSYGIRPAGPPPLAALPPAARLINKAFMWGFALMVNDPGGTASAPSTSRTLNGAAAAPGRYRGPTRVVRDESEFGKIQAGDVLVCPIASPAWSVLFPSIGAMVTDTGGMLAHSAIISREFGIPAVVGTDTATETLRDDQVVTVDGSTGTVWL